MRRSTGAVWILGLTVFLSAGCGKPEATKEGNRTQKTEKIAIAAASAGGGFYMGASALANVINSKLEGVEATVETTGASKHNVQLLQAGEVKFGLCATEVAWEALNGKFVSKDRIFRTENHHSRWPSVYSFVTLRSRVYARLPTLTGKPSAAGRKEVPTKFLPSGFSIPSVSS
jgi:hypothetical protein